MQKILKYSTTNLAKNVFVLASYSNCSTNT